LSAATFANQITQWKSQLLEGAVAVFGGETKAEAATATVDLKTLHLSPLN
jgi:transposase